VSLGYYPGCALHGSSNDYGQSVQACLSLLGIDLVEVDDWICCGATAAHSLNRTLSIALPARNLAVAERDGMGEVLAPCPLCSMQLLRSRKLVREDLELRRSLSDIVELPVTGSTDVLNLIQVFQQIGVESLAARAVRRLEEFRPACYYGCMLTRPGAVVEFDDPEHPTSMETILTALGAAPVSWNFATECCGAGMTMADSDTVVDLAHRILSNAHAHDANCVVVACPMCHVNLDLKQQEVEQRTSTSHQLPIYYLSDLVGLALGLDESALGIDRHLVSSQLAGTTATTGGTTTDGGR
jgi:heterodisulfide reductase subunit B